MVQRIIQIGTVITLGALVLIQGFAANIRGNYQDAQAAPQTATACSDEGYALWADNLDGPSPVLDWPGSGSQIDGNVHSNADIRLSGSNNVITGTVEFVTSFADEGGGNQYATPVQVSPDIIPVSYSLTAYQPEGAAAVIAQQEGRYHYINDDLVVEEGDVLADGLYYVTGEVVISASSFSATVTIVSEREIELSGSEQNLTPYSDGLLLFSTRSAASGPAIRISGSNSELRGIIYAPNAQLEVSGSGNVFAGGLYGYRLKLSGSSLTIAFDAQYCPPEPPPPTATPTPSPTNTPVPTPPPGTVMSMQYLPLTATNPVQNWGEPNNSCAEAYGIEPSITYFFFAEDLHDWYHFTLTDAAEVTVQLANFVPRDGQLAIWRGDSCDTTTFLQSNGDSVVTKTLNLGFQPAGHFFVYISNDGVYNTTDPYSLWIDVR